MSATSTTSEIPIVILFIDEQGQSIHQLKHLMPVQMSQRQITVMVVDDGPEILIRDVHDQLNRLVREQMLPTEAGERETRQILIDSLTMIGLESVTGPRNKGPRPPPFHYQSRFQVQKQRSGPRPPPCSRSQRDHGRRRRQALAIRVRNGKT